MQLVTDDTFVSWLDARGIALNPRYPEGWEHLAYRDAAVEWAEWDLPPEPSALPAFVTTALRAAAPDGPYWLYPRGRGAWAVDAALSPAADVVARIRRAAGIPDGFVGAVGFAAGELPALWMLLSAAFVFGAAHVPDLYVIPDDGSCILMTCHHDELHVQLRTPERCADFARAMAASGFAPPADDPEDDPEDG